MICYIKGKRFVCVCEGWEGGGSVGEHRRKESEVVDAGTTDDPHTMLQIKASTLQPTEGVNETQWGLTCTVSERGWHNEQFIL